jgi:signal transduction histidine kinase
MSSVRRHVMVGAILWTVGLLAVWAVGITLYGAWLRPVIVIHSYPHALGLVAISAMIAGFFIVRAGLRPLDSLRQKLAAVRTGAARGVDGHYPAEVQPLVRDLNALLTHKEAAVARAVAKAADLAHGLKTPLAILAQEADRAAAQRPELAAAIAEQVERMRQQIDYHLAHARAAASGATPGASCLVRESADGLARTLLRLHAERGLTIEVQVDPAHAVRCRRDDLDEILGNLIDNACKWGRSRVVVSSRLADAVIVTVEDDGPGAAPGERQRVLARGARADETAPGSGIGLAIVRELAELYGGSVALESSALGGLRAVLRLPAAG